MDQISTDTVVVPLYRYYLESASYVKSSRQEEKSSYIWKEPDSNRFCLQGDGFCGMGLINEGSGELDYFQLVMQSSSPNLDVIKFNWNITK